MIENSRFWIERNLKHLSLFAELFIAVFCRFEALVVVNNKNMVLSHPLVDLRLGFAGFALLFVALLKLKQQDLSNIRVPIAGEFNWHQRAFHHVDVLLEFVFH